MTPFGALLYVGSGCFFSCLLVVSVNKKLVTGGYCGIGLVQVEYARVPSTLVGGSPKARKTKAPETYVNRGPVLSNLDNWKDSASPKKEQALCRKNRY